MSQHRVIVIGSGIAGASTAFALARRGAAVTIVDSADTGQATDASAGIISPWASTAEGPFYELYAAGAAYYPQVIELLAEAGSTRTDYRRTGALLVSADEEKLRAAQDRVEARARTAVPSWARSSGWATRTPAPSSPRWPPTWTACSSRAAAGSTGAPCATRS
ncbi:NAD(P)/FAD-dependent oxidoreductase [Streptosporangium sp. NBC_01756]|uniref:NAD(P)/FAD-dependent oxidoreductase n=1 Tax=Streptosporangium sp. NBC_01756 TaxID=2975950 RepID=UPI002DD84F98|nr:FAD-dependent oxidoreductase [Streptosporangium sp. NBC_01756]WSC85543.1 FAD-binding oxidoreductase [Streptosporangium sp. NBC_01756]